MDNENTENDLRMIDELNPSEHKALKAFIDGYGRIKYASQISGLNARTLERIAIRGSGLKENIDAIRAKILNQETTK